MERGDTTTDMIGRHSNHSTNFARVCIINGRHSPVQRNDELDTGISKGNKPKVS